MALKVKAVEKLIKFDKESAGTYRYVMKPEMYSSLSQAKVIKEAALHSGVSGRAQRNRIGDVMRTPSMNDLSVHLLCNLPASVKRLPRGAQPAIGKRNVLGFLNVIDESPDQTDAAMLL